MSRADCLPKRFATSSTRPKDWRRRPSSIHQLVNGDDRGLAETALAGRTLLGGERLAAGFLPVGHVHRGHPSLCVEGRRREGGRHVRRQLPPRTAARRVQGVAARHGVEPRIASRRSRRFPTLLLSGEFDPVTPPSGAEEVVAGLSQRPSRRHPQQRPSDRQCRKVHRPDDRPVPRSRHRPTVSISAAPPRTPLRRSCVSGKEPMTNVLSDLKHGFRVLLRTPLFTICTIAALAIGIGVDDRALQRRACAADEAAALPGRGLAGRDVGAQPAAQPAAQRDQPGELPGVARTQPIVRRHGGVHAEPRHADRQRRAAGAGRRSIVTANMLDVLGVAPMLGRGFAAGEDRQGAAAHRWSCRTRHGCGSSAATPA